MFDIASIGDTTVDVFLDIDEAQVTCDLDTDACRISFNYADKIPVKSIKEIVAVGNAANNAVGSARLGLKAALYTHLGNDGPGEKMRKALIERGIDEKYIVTDSDAASNYSTVLNYKGERTILVYHEPRKYQLPVFEDVKWIYLTSVAAGHETLHEEVISVIQKSNIKLGFNPGTHQLNTGLDSLKPLMAISSVFIVNKEEAEKLVGKAESINDLLEKVKSYGSENVVITDGKNGSFAYDGNDMWHLGILDAPVIERTGTGDAYSTGIIAAFIEEKSIDEAMMWGNLNSTSVLQHIGAQEGLLTHDQMQKDLQAHSNFKPKKIYI